MPKGNTLIEIGNRSTLLAQHNTNALTRGIRLYNKKAIEIGQCWTGAEVTACLSAVKAC